MFGYKWIWLALTPTLLLSMLGGFLVFEILSNEKLDS